jgi:hypothetical protein
MMSKKHVVTFRVAIEVDASNPKTAVDSANEFVTRALNYSGDAITRLREDGVLWMDVFEDASVAPQVPQIPVENTTVLWYNRVSAKGN